MALSERRCKARTASGAPCRAPSNMVDPLHLLCAAHLDPEQNALNARKGGVATAKRRQKRPRMEDLGPLETVADAQRWLQQITIWVGDRKLTHAEGKTMQGSVSAWLRAHETRVKVEQLEALREEVRRLRDERAGADRGKVRAVS